MSAAESELTTGTEAEAQTAAAAANPALIGVPTFIIGALCLALFLLGYQGGSPNGMLAVLIGVTSIGQFVAAGWAMRLGSGPVAAVFSIFGGFWLSFPILLLGNAHGWFVAGGTDSAAANKGGTIVYLLAWTIVIAILTLATLRLPLAFTALFALVTLTFLVVLLSYLTGVTAFATIGGILVFAFAAIGVYLFFDAMSSATGGKALPLGRPLVK